MSVRNSMFQRLGRQYPIYQRMYQLARTIQSRFKLNQNARAWAQTMGGTIRSEVRANYACGSDHTVSQPIQNNADAQTLCPDACNMYGGWNGQWTNQAPGAGSVCGCKLCPVN